MWPPLAAQPGSQTAPLGLSPRAMDSLRPWRKAALQVVTVEAWRQAAARREEPDGARQTDGARKEVPDGEVLHQVGGHGSVDKAQAMQVSREGQVLKPIQSGERGMREVSFYTNISSATDPTAAAFYQLTPQFFGVTSKAQEDGSKADFLMMENLTKGYRLPCIMDIKIGARTWGPDSNPAKRAAQDASYAGTKVPFGFSVPGLSVYLGTSTQGGSKPEQVVHGKEFGRSLGADTAGTLVPLFLGRGTREQAARLLADIFVEKLQKIQTLFKDQTMFHLFGSSLLLVYDAAACNELDRSKLESSVCVKMIDFAHVWPAEDKLDENYLNGVNNLIMLFEKLV